jgi:PBSX family phage terminase large subunit
MARYIMLYGGSRSGKTFIICYALIVRALMVKSRHVILRLKFNHVKTSIWMDTLPKVINTCFENLNTILVRNNTDYFLKFPNGSEIWVSGLDDKIRTEKILGKEYSTIFFNESSQISYQSVEMALTRLAEKNDLVKKAYFDENPPQKSHWSYSLFIKNKDPKTWEQKDKSKYASLLMNPDDNIENIDEEYISEILENLSPKERDRFRLGLWSEAAEGAVYYAFNSEKHIQDFQRLTTPVKVGCDFNVNPMTAVVCYYQNDKFYIYDEFYKENSNTYEMAEFIKNKYGLCEFYPDSTGSARKTSATRSDHQIIKDYGHNVARVANPHVKDRYNCLNGLFSRDKILINPRCKMLIKDLEEFCHDNKDPMLSHITDALGYLCWGLEPMLKMGKIKVNY